jgi:hypothetical protein
LPKLLHTVFSSRLPVLNYPIYAFDVKKKKKKEIDEHSRRYEVDELGNPIDWTPYEKDDEVMRDTEEDFYRTEDPWMRRVRKERTRSSPMRTETENWEGETPAQAASDYHERIKETLLNMPQEHMSTCVQAIYDTLEVCQTKRIKIKRKAAKSTFEGKEHSQSRGWKTEKKEKDKKDKNKDITNLKKQVLETLKSVEQFEKEMYFLTKLEIVELAAKKAVAPPPKPEQQKRDPKNPWGKGKSLVKGIKANTLVLNHDQEEEIDPAAPHAALVKVTEKDVSINKVSIARSGAVVVETAKPMSHETKKKLHQAVNTNVFGGRDVTKELVRPTYSSLKFDFVPLCFGDGTEMSDQEVNAFVRAHPKWEKVQFTEPIKHIENARMPGVATLLCKVVDDDQGTVVKVLLSTLVRFGPEMRRCREWFNKPNTKQCSICQRWGHTAYNCRAKNP